MTFTEAAVEVLRLVGKPLHYKKITEVAIERSLLSHVGKTPEVTMSSRLATMVKRDRGDAPIIKVKPGVFGLREFSEQQLSDLSGDVDELPEVSVESEQNKNEEAEAVDAGAEAKAKLEVKRPLPGADVFPEEADDDEPILGGPAEEEDDDDDEEDAAAEGGSEAANESRSARRRRKRRRRGGAEEPAEEPRVARERTENEPRGGGERGRERNERSGNERERNERSGSERERNERSGNERDRNKDRERGGDRGERDRERSERERSDRERGERDRSERDRERHERSDRDRHDRDRDRRDPSGDYHREPADGDLLGKDLADAVASVLAQSSPRGFPALRVADLLVRRGRLSGDAQLLVPTVMAAVRADISRRSGDVVRPRFRIENGQIQLTDLLVPQDVVRAEQDVLRAAERQRERARRAFLRKVSELPATGLAELVATWLNAEGVVGLRAVRRPVSGSGSGSGELHLAGTLRRGVEEVRLAIVVYRDGRELGRERVVEARGALHYYGSATSAWIVSLGNVMSGAREEALAPATAPVSLFDGMALASAMERVGVGLAAREITVSAIDFEFLDALRGPRERDDRDDRRERDDRRDDRRDRDERRERDDRRGRDERRERSERDERREPPRAASVDDEEAVEPIEADDDEGGPAPAEARAVDPAAAQNGDQREGRRRKRRRRRKGRGEARDDAPVQGGASEPGEGEGDYEGDDTGGAEGEADYERDDEAAPARGDADEASYDEAEERRADDEEREAELDREADDLDDADLDDELDEDLARDDDDEREVDGDAEDHDDEHDDDPAHRDHDAPRDDAASDDPDDEPRR